MIYIVTAMYAEAHAFITRFQLKKELSHTRFQVFLNKEANLCLIISGTGSVAASVAVSSICTEYGTGPEAFLLNAGVCAQVCNRQKTSHEAETETAVRIGRLFLCSKIKEEVTGRTFYPDILYRHDFAEAQIITGAHPYQKAMPAPVASDFYLYDMEAAAVYQAGAYYFGPHQMSFLKVVSDDGNTGNVTPGQIKRLMNENMDKIAGYLSVLAANPSNIQHDITQTDRVQKDLEKLCLDLHCSRTMSESLRQHIRYCILSGVDYTAVLEEMYREGRLPCKDKREGKQCFEELKERLL